MDTITRKALIKAAAENDRDVLNRILERYSGPSYVVQGSLSSALVAAIEAGHPQMVRTLCEYGCVIDPCNVARLDSEVLSAVLLITAWSRRGRSSFDDEQQPGYLQYIAGLWLGLR